MYDKTQEEVIADAMPEFLKPENIKDANGKRPNDPEYDETTLLIPERYWKDFTPAKTQYWTIKKDNFEKILFFKLGKFYEIFDSDAVICQKLLDLNWMGGAAKLHVGFPERVLDKYLRKLVDRGYKVAVIEQIETPRMAEKRVEEIKKVRKVEKHEKCVNRDIIQMVTRGTFADGNLLGESVNAHFEPKYILAYKKVASTFGVTFLDPHTLKIFIGHFKENDENLMQSFRTLLSQMRPVEVI